MLRFSAVICVLLMIIAVIYPGTLLAQKPAIVGGEPIVDIDATDNSGSTWIHLRNNTRDSMGIYLHVGNFISQLTPVKPQISANVAFRQAESQKADHFFEAKLPPGRSLFVILEISNFREAGEAYAYLLNREDTVTIIRAVKFNVPFGVSLDVADPNHPELSFQRYRKGLLVFKNEDPMTYTVHWSLLVPEVGAILGQDTTILPGRSSMPVTLDPPADAFKSWFSGFFKDQVQEGRMVLRFVAPGDVGHPALPTKTLPVKVKMRYWSGGWQSFVSNSLILSVLIVGGLFSLFLNLWIPNKLRRLGLLRNIERSARKTETISRKIDSSLRVEARAESFRLAELIKSVGLLNTDALSIFENYKRDIELLDRRVGIILELDAASDTLESLRAKISDAPAKILDDVGKRLDEATRLLKLPALEEITFQQAQEIIRGASERLRNVTDEDQRLAEQLATFVGDLIESYSDVAGKLGIIPKCKELREKLKGLFDLLIKPQYKDKSKILPMHYHWLSSTTERLFVLRHYIRDWEEASQEKRDRMIAHENDLLDYLRSRTWNDLQLARQLRIEMWEEIFEGTIERALADKDFSINWVPILPLPNQSVQLEVKFNSHRLNSCMARHDFTCIWDFYTIGTEEGWQISHYFRNKAEAKFRVHFRKPDGKKLMKREGNEEVEVEEICKVQLQTQPKKKSDERRRIEVVRMAVALLVAILGLIAGAREQLMKLDVFSGLVGVFLIGVAADTVKNLITKRSEGET